MTYRYNPETRQLEQLATDPPNPMGISFYGSLEAYEQAVKEYEATLRKLDTAPGTEWPEVVTDKDFSLVENCNICGAIDRCSVYSKENTCKFLSKTAVPIYPVSAAAGGDKFVCENVEIGKDRCEKQCDYCNPFKESVIDKSFEPAPSGYSLDQMRECWEAAMKFYFGGVINHPPDRDIYLSSLTPSAGNGVEDQLALWHDITIEIMENPNCIEELRKRYFINSLKHTK